MKIYCSFILIVLCFAISASSHYTITSPYLQNPQKAIGYVDSCAQFWVNTWDNNLGGFFTNIDRYGNVIWNNDKYMLTQSRNAYGLARTYMLTGDTAYLNLAKSALQFMYQHAWDPNFGGWYNELNSNGYPIYPFDNKSAFFQHYALLGIAAYYEATHDTTAWNWLMKGYNHLESRFWDTRPAYSGYYDEINYSGTYAFNKSFNATVDAVTTHLLYLYLMTRDQTYLNRLQEISAEMLNHLVASMPAQAIGFVELYDSNWNWNNTDTTTLMGHVLKTAWCLGRIHKIDPVAGYLPAADSLFYDVWHKGYDHQNGGPYKDFNRITGELLLWGNPDTTKAWWQMEQAVTAGLLLFSINRDSVYLKIADESLDFFMKHFVDHQYGEVYAYRTRYGGFAWSEDKANGWKAGYHSIELGYYIYLYGNLFLHQQPITLHYYFEPSQQTRDIILTPLAIGNSELKIQAVLKENQLYTNFDPATRVLTLLPGDAGHFTVTFEPVSVPIVSNDDAEIKSNSFILKQNYPNPFNPSTTIEIALPRPAYITLKIYNILGEEVAKLVSDRLTAGKYKYDWDASGLASGVYLCCLETGSFKQTKKLILLK